MKLCKDCTSYAYCVFNGYTTEGGAAPARSMYERPWWKFWVKA